MTAFGEPVGPGTCAPEKARNLPQPEYGIGGLAGVMPAAAHSLGVPGFVEADAGFPEASRAVVVLVDGLGDRLLRRRGGHAPFLRSLLPDGRTLMAGFPTTTATSLASLGTGLPPGAHGMVGYEAFDPVSDAVFNELSWKDGPDPVVWQPFDTVFHRVAAHIEVVSVGPAQFHGSGLTAAALRGPRYSAAEALQDRIEVTLSALRAHRRVLVYLYWGEVDKVGHAHGCESWQWGDELERIDSALAELSRRVPLGTAVYITADHGMVDTDPAGRIDLALRPDLDAGVRAVAGDPRAPHLHTHPGAAAEVAATWREVLADAAWVATRDDAIDAGVFGPVRAEVVPRLGDVVVAMRHNHVLLDSRRNAAGLMGLVGHHGSLTADELAIPLLTVAPR